MSVQLRWLSHPSLFFIQDHVYELLNTIDACQCFFDIVSIGQKNVLLHMKHKLPPDFSSPPVEFVWFITVIIKVTLSALHMLYFSELWLLFYILDALSFNHRSMSVHDLSSGTVVFADLGLIFCIWQVEPLSKSSFYYITIVKHFFTLEHLSHWFYVFFLSWK